MKMSSGKNKLVIDKDISRSNFTIENEDEVDQTKQTKNLQINLSPMLKRSKVNVWVKDGDYGNTGVSINRPLNTRNNTCPQINTHGGESSIYATSPRNTQSMSLPHNSTRKSFFGELKNLLTFNKRKEDGNETAESSQQQQNSAADDPTMGNISIEKEYEKENKKVVLQNRRKQVFHSQQVEQQQDDFQSVGSRVNKIQMSIKKWKIKKNTEATRDTIAVNKHHQKILDECYEQLQTEVPFPIHIVIKEESLKVTTKVHQMYKSMLGSKHQLTQEAEKHIKFIRQSMYVHETI